MHHDLKTILTLFYIKKKFGKYVSGEGNIYGAKGQILLRVNI